MRVVITQPWQAEGFPPATLAPGQVFDLPGSIAIYLFAMRCAQRASSRRRSLIHRALQCCRAAWAKLFKAR